MCRFNSGVSLTPFFFLKPSTQAMTSSSTATNFCKTIATTGVWSKPVDFAFGHIDVNIASFQATCPVLL